MSYNPLYTNAALVKSNKLFIDSGCCCPSCKVDLISRRYDPSTYNDLLDNYADVQPSAIYDFHNLVGTCVFGDPSCNGQICEDYGFANVLYKNGGAAYGTYYHWSKIAGYLVNYRGTWNLFSGQVNVYQVSGGPLTNTANICGIQVEGQRQGSLICTPKTNSCYCDGTGWSGQTEAMPLDGPVTKLTDYPAPDCPTNYNVTFDWTHALYNVFYNATTRVSTINTFANSSNPPGNPVNNGIYVVSTSPTGAWAGHPNLLAKWTDSTWVHIINRQDNAPTSGVNDGDEYVVGSSPDISGNAWSGETNNYAYASVSGGPCNYNGTTGSDAPNDLCNYEGSYELSNFSGGGILTLLECIAGPDVWFYPLLPPTDGDIFCDNSNNKWIYNSSSGNWYSYTPPISWTFSGATSGDVAGNSGTGLYWKYDGTNWNSVSKPGTWLFSGFSGEVYFSSYADCRTILTAAPESGLYYWNHGWFNNYPSASGYVSGYPTTANTVYGYCDKVYYCGEPSFIKSLTTITCGISFPFFQNSLYTNLCPTDLVNFTPNPTPQSSHLELYIDGNVNHLTTKFYGSGSGTFTNCISSLTMYSDSSPIISGIATVTGNGNEAYIYDKSGIISGCLDPNQPNVTLNITGNDINELAFIDSPRTGSNTIKWSDFNGLYVYSSGTNNIWYKNGSTDKFIYVVPTGVDVNGNFIFSVRAVYINPTYPTSSGEISLINCSGLIFSNATISGYANNYCVTPVSGHLLKYTAGVTLYPPYQNMDVTGTVMFNGGAITTSGTCGKPTTTVVQNCSRHPNNLSISIITDKSHATSSYSVKGIQNDPPSSGMSIGDYYAIGSAPTGVWTSYPLQIAEFTGTGISGWQYVVANYGTVVALSVSGNDLYYKHSGCGTANWYDTTPDCLNTGWNGINVALSGMLQPCSTSNFNNDYTLYPVTGGYSGRGEWGWYFSGSPTNIFTVSFTDPFCTHNYPYYTFQGSLSNPTFSWDGGGTTLLYSDCSNITCNNTNHKITGYFDIIPKIYPFTKIRYTVN